MAATGGGAPMYSGYGQPPKVRFEVIAEAWQLFTQQMGTWIMAVVIMVGIMMVPIVVMMFAVILPIMAAASGNHDAGAAMGIGMLLIMGVGMIVVAAVSIVLMAGMFRMAIKQVRGEPIQISDLWSATDVFWNLLGGMFLVGLATAAGSMLCYLPGLVVAGLFMLSIPLIVDQKLGPIEAMSRSWNLLKQEWLMAGLLYLVLTCIMGLGGMVVVGILFTYPLFFLGIALVYRDFVLGTGVPAPGAPYPYGVAPGAYPPAPYPVEPPPSELR